MRAAPLETPPPPDRAPSSVAPLIIALAVGLTMGFAAGYGVGTRQSPAPAAATAAPPPLAPAGQEFTETAVAPPPPAAAPAAPAEAKSEAGSQKSEVGSQKADVGSQKVGSQKSEAPVAKPEPDGRLLVRSTPAGARVFVDGQEYGPTPATVARSGRRWTSRARRPRWLRHRRTARRDHPVATGAVADGRARAARRRCVAGAQPAPPAAPAGPATRFTGALTSFRGRRARRCSWTASSWARRR